MTARPYIPRSRPLHAVASLAWRTVQGVAALACCASFGAGVASLSFIFIR